MNIVMENSKTFRSRTLDDMLVLTTFKQTIAEASMSHKKNL